MCEMLVSLSFCFLIFFYADKPCCFVSSISSCFLYSYSFISFSPLGSLNSHFLYQLSLKIERDFCNFFCLCILLPTQLTLIDSVLLYSSTQSLLQSGGQSQNQPSLFLSQHKKTQIFSPCITKSKLLSLTIRLNFGPR